MKNDNSMFQVLVATTLEAKAKAMSDLVANELGVFDVDTGVTIDSTTAAAAKAIKMFMIPTNSNNILKSVGKEINLKRLNSVTKKAYTTGVDAVIEVTFPAIGDDADAVIPEGEPIGVTFRIADSKIMTTVYGNEVRKFFMLEALSGQDATATAFAAMINNDVESTTNGGFISATAADEVVTITFANSNTDGSLTLYNKSVTAYPSDTNITIDTNDDGGTLTPHFAYAQGKGAFVQELERIAAGWNGSTGLGAYRFRGLLPLYSEFEPEASASAGYNLYVFNYDLDYPQNVNKINNVETIVAIPSTATTMITNFEAIVSALTTDAKLIGF